MIAVKLAKFLRTPILKNICELLLLVVAKVPYCWSSKNDWLNTNDKKQFLKQTPQRHTLIKFQKFVIISFQRNLWTTVPANICWSWRRLEDVFKTCLEEVFNTSSA